MCIMCWWHLSQMTPTPQTRRETDQNRITLQKKRLLQGWYARVFIATVYTCMHGGRHVCSCVNVSVFGLYMSHSGALLFMGLYYPRRWRNGSGGWDSVFLGQSTCHWTSCAMNWFSLDQGCPILIRKRPVWVQGFVLGQHCNSWFCFSSSWLTMAGYLVESGVRVLGQNKTPTLTPTLLF